MTRVLTVLLLLLCIAPVALADSTAAAPAEAAPPQAPATAAPVLDLEALTTDELFSELDATKGAEEKKMCWPTTSCTYDSECELNQQPADCNYQRVCDNPTGLACAGTCVCC